jgi:hypothetical protein
MQNPFQLEYNIYITHHHHIGNNPYLINGGMCEKF